jgi:D-alanyl-D-alanine carboxypeptidase (penicillin-binding protein 5/6)
VTRRAPALLAAVTVALVCAAGIAPGSRALAAPPALQARAAIVVQPDTRTVVAARNPDARRPIASTTKLMTALLVLERLDLNDVLTVVPYRAAPAESVAGFRAGERLTVADLLRALLLPSANDAAETLAVDVAGSRKAFVRLMNSRARELGLTNTHYANPIGLDQPGNYSSARDLVELALILRRHPFFVHTTNLPRAVLHSGARRRVVVNRNTLIRRVPFIDGVKTGHTGGAGYVLVGSATRGGVTVLSAVLGDPNEASRDADSLALLRYGLDRYRRVTPVVARRRYAEAKLKDQGGDRVALVAAGTLRRVAQRGRAVTTRVSGAPGTVTGPLPAGSREGTIEVLEGGRVVARVPLVTAKPVPEATITERMRAWLGRTLTILLLAALAICSLQLVLLRRRAVRRRLAGGAKAS